MKSLVLKFGFSLCLVLFFGNTLRAQQEAMFTQYMFNGLTINPAYAGSHNTVSMSTVLRKQWVGLDGAPSTQSFSVHSPLGASRVGMGLILFHDNIGISNQYGAYSSYSYKIPINIGEETFVYFGLQAGYNYYNISYSDVSSSDPTYNGGDINEYYPNVGTGVYLASKRFYFGVSIPQLLTAKNLEYDGPLFQQVYHTFISTGYVFDLNENLKLKPNLLIKAVEGAPVEADLNLNLLIKEVLWVGASWRSFDSIDGLVLLQLSERLQMGYSYDFGTTELNRVNAGSHEVSLNYLFSFNKKRIITPRYF